jgi:outer membrane protein, multidrug efflux system
MVNFFSVGKRLFRLALALGGSVMLVSGCAVKDPPQSEEIRKEALAEVELPPTWKEGGEPGVILDNWLATFSDPQLSVLVEEALQHNPDLRVSSTRVEQAAEYVNMAKSALYPAINLLGTGGVKSGGGDLSSAIQGLVLPITWEIDLWGRLRYGRNAAEEDSRSVQADFAYARQSIAAAVARSWFTVSETWLQRQIALEMVQSAGKLLALAEIRHKVGAGNEQDVALARASLGTLRDGAKQIELARQQAIRALELLIGRYPAAELKARRELTALPGSVPVGMPLEMLERRPDLIAAERRIAAAFNRVGEAKMARLPKITLNASVAAMTSEVIQLKENYDNPTSGAGARFVAPVYQGGALVTQVEIRTLEQKEAVAVYAASALKALNEVESALAAGGNLTEREQLLQQAVNDNRRALELVETSYRTGKADMRAVQSQLLDLQAASLSLLRVQSEQLSQRVNLHLALGGSFTQNM